MNRSLSSREKFLAAAVAIVGVLLATVFLADWFLQSRTRWRAEIAARSRQLRFAQTLIDDLPFWEQRDAWARAAQPKLESNDTAGVQLLDDLKSLARKHGVLLENPAIRPAESQSTAVTVEVETKCAWPPLIGFLHELQSPERFVAVESANLRLDAEDQTRLHGHFKIARWYAQP